MQLQDFEVYTHLYELGSINLTAAALGYAQSNITARLKVIEQEFDAQLFTRSYQGITPTAAGRRFYDYAKQVLAATAAVRRALQAAPAHRRVVLSSLLFNLLVGEQGRYDLKHTTVTTMSSTQINHLTPAAADEIVTYANGHPQGFQQVAQAYLPAAFVAAKATAGAQLPVLVNRDRQCPFRQRTLRRYRHQPRRIIEVDTWDSMLALIRHGRGLALLPLDIAAAEGFVNVQPASHYRIPYRTFIPAALSN